MGKFKVKKSEIEWIILNNPLIIENQVSVTLVYDLCVVNKRQIFRYRTWSLGNMSDGTPIKVVARTENDGVILGANGEIQKLTIKAFNEWDSGVS